MDHIYPRNVVGIAQETEELSSNLHLRHGINDVSADDVLQFKSFAKIMNVNSLSGNNILGTRAHGSATGLMTRGWRNIKIQHRV